MLTPHLEPFFQFLTFYYTSLFAAITTVEGILERTAAGLEQDQPVRKALDPEGAAQIEGYLLKIADLRELKTNFTVVRKTHTMRVFFMRKIIIVCVCFEVFIYFRHRGKLRRLP